MAKLEPGKVAFYATWGGKNEPPHSGHTVLFRLRVPETELPATIYMAGLVDVRVEVYFFIEGEKIKVGGCTKYKLTEGEHGDAVVTFKTDLDGWLVTKEEQKKFDDRLITVLLLEESAIMNANENAKEEEHV